MCTIATLAITKVMIMLTKITIIGKIKDIVIGNGNLKK